METLGEASIRFVLALRLPVSIDGLGARKVTRIFGPKNRNSRDLSRPSVFLHENCGPIAAQRNYALAVARALTRLFRRLL